MALINCCCGARRLFVVAIGATLGVLDILIHLVAGCEDLPDLRGGTVDSSSSLSSSSDSSSDSDDSSRSGDVVLLFLVGILGELLETCLPFKQSTRPWSLSLMSKFSTFVRVSSVTASSSGRAFGSVVQKLVWVYF